MVFTRFHAFPTIFHILIKKKEEKNYEEGIIDLLYNWFVMQNINYIMQNRW